MPLRAPGEILLLSTYELGHQPMGLALPLGFLAEAGFQPAAQDLTVESLDEARVRAARFVGLSVPMHTALRLAMRVARRVRALNPSAHLCFYGLYAPLHREHLLGAGADSVLGGELERELVALVTRLDAGDAAEPPPITLDRLRFALPLRDRLPPLSRYARLLTPTGERVAGYVEATRGCLHRCRHCPIPVVYEGRFFVVQAETVLADIRRQVAAGAGHITFGDPDFLNGPEHTMAIVRAMHAEHPALTFDLTAKIEHLLRHRARLAELRALGCLFIVSAVESLSPRVLEILDKGHTRADVDRALDFVSAAGITLRPSLVPFTPWTTLADYQEQLDWIAARGIIDHLDPVHLAIRLLIPPGSLLAAHPATLPHLGALDADGLTYRWTHPDPRMDALQLTALAAVESAAAAGEDPRTTFERVQTLALAAAKGGRLEAP
ncbi:MAG TPA: CUAEP/CCAEP-tail radical SAM protein, partial [Kofleriaceae bacterium]|nr:CUAEP/CCAEP-tail radical SAM protein [Kofleriaceae bacterium]